MASNRLPLITVRGGPYERGVQHGSQCGDLIRRYQDVLLQTVSQEASLRALDTSRQLTRDDLLARAMTFLPQMEAFAPHLIEEVRGIADGAKVEFAEALLINVRAEVMGVTSIGAGGMPVGAGIDACTAFGLGRTATYSRSIMSGQNLDQNPLNQDLQIVLKVEPDEGPAMLMCTFAGLVGYPGINEHGISFFQNALSTSFWMETGIPHYFLKRVLLEQTTLDDCLDVIANAPVCSSANYVLTDEHEILNIELTPDDYAVGVAENDLVVHTNHFFCPTFARDDQLLPMMPDSTERAIRLTDRINRRLSIITLDDMKLFLSDHDGYPTGICRHDESMVTISSIIAEPTQGRMHIALGNPCTSEYVTYSL